MMLTLMLTSKGVAGVPRGALVVLTATLTQFGLPLEGAAILLGIDQIMDMGRTAVNVMGNCIATAVVARWEGVFDDDRCGFRRTRDQPPDADRRRRRARPARRRRRSRVRAAATTSIAFDRAALDVTDDRAVAVADGAGAAGRHRQLRGVQRRGRRRGSAGRRAERATRLPSARWRAAARQSAPRSSTTAPISCSTARRATPYAEDRSRRIRGASTPRRSCSASGSPPTRRARTCCASRACSAARRERPPAKGSVASILRALEAGNEAQGVRRPHRVADLRHRRRARDAEPPRARRAAGPLSLRELRAMHVARVRAGGRASAEASSRSSCRCAWPT